MHLKKVDESVVVVISLSNIIDLSSWEARAGRRTEDMNAKLSVRKAPSFVVTRKAIINHSIKHCGY